MEIAVAITLAYLLLIPEGVLCLVIYMAGAKAFNKGEGFSSKILDMIKGGDLQGTKALCMAAKATEEGFAATVVKMMEAKTPEDAYEEMVLYKSRTNKQLKKSVLLRLAIPYALAVTACTVPLLFLGGFVPWVTAVILFAAVQDREAVSGDQHGRAVGHVLADLHDRAAEAVALVAREGERGQLIGGVGAGHGQILLAW